MKSYTSYLILLCALFLNTNSYSQKIEWNYKPQKGFVYEISNSEAKELLTNNKLSKRTMFKSMMHTLVDTFVVDKGWRNQPKQGHFILADIEKNKLHCNYHCVFPFEMYMHKEYNSLTIQVIDVNGVVRDDAKVRLNKQRLQFDEQAQLYRFDGIWSSSKSKLASIYLDGFTAYYNIKVNKPYNPSDYSPHNNNDEGRIYSYLVCDKNKYRPNDSIRFKTYAVNSNMQPLRKDLSVYLSQGRIYKKIGTVKRHRPGAYASTIYLNDSLNLVLDKRCSIYLKTEKGKVVSSTSFLHEDYELRNATINSSLAGNKHFVLNSNTLSITATDANGLLLNGAKAQVTVKIERINSCFTDLLLLKDTLINKTIDLAASGPTTFIIPDTIFKQTNTDYSVIVEVTSAENHTYKRVHHCTYYHSNFHYDFYLEADSVCIDMFYNGDLQSNVPFELYYNIDSLNSKSITLPYKEKFSQDVTSYSINSNNRSQQFYANTLNDHLAIDGFFEADSFKVNINNPHNLNLNWNIYKGETLIDYGFGNEISHSSFIPNRDSTYYVDVFYTLGGDKEELHREYLFKTGALNINMDMPDKIFPGQKVDALIKVTDYAGYPVRGVDITAMAFNSQLNYWVPSLPFYGTNSKARGEGDKFNLTHFRVSDMKLNLDYSKYSKLARLDTMQYYNFSYPINTFFEHSITISDSTQFAPFVMKDGMAQEIYYIEVDREPVYYSWVDMPDKYAFYIRPDTIHEISIRLADQLLVIDSLNFAANKKHIFSFQLDSLPVNTMVLNKTSTKIRKLNTLWPRYRNYNVYELTNQELAKHKKYISQVNTGSLYSYLQSKNNFYPISYNWDKQIKTVGPIPQGNIEFCRKENYKVSYLHEGYYRYNFVANVVYKLSLEEVIPEALSMRSFDPYTILNDTVLTKAAFMQKLKSRVPIGGSYTSEHLSGNNSGIKWNATLPKVENANGVVSLLIEFANSCKFEVLYGYGLNNYYTNIDIPSELVNIVLLYKDGSYIEKDSILLQNNIHLRLDFSNDERRPSDERSIIFQSIFPKNYQPVLGNKPRPNYSLVSKQWVSNNSGYISGTVIAEEDGLPIPGVSIVVKGTTNGTITDMDGTYTLEANMDDVLSFSFIGMKTKEAEVHNKKYIDVALESEELNLDEVVVIGYGTMRKREVTGAVSRVSSESLGISTEIEEDIQPEVQPTNEEVLYNELLNIHTLRSNFSDVGFWQPKLYTDRRGESKFTVKFPDDITQWNAVVLGMNKRLKAGTYRQAIKSYKPIMAELKVPRFLTIGDSCALLGQMSNHTNDSIITGQIEWQANGILKTEALTFTNSKILKSAIKAIAADTLTASLKFTRTDGYLDGEERKIPTVEQGCIRAEGTLEVLEKGEVKIITTTKQQELTIELLDNPIDIYTNEIGNLIEYKYACNEQLASKLIGLLNYKLLMQAQGKAFEYEKDIKKIIKRLVNNQNNKYQWSWWNKNEYSSLWITAHVYSALAEAREAGYVIDINWVRLEQNAQYNYRFKAELSNLDELCALSKVNVPLKWQQITQQLDQQLFEQDSINKAKVDSFRYYRMPSLLNKRLKLMELKQQQGLPFQKDLLLKYKCQGILGEVFFDDKLPSNWWYTNKIDNNAIAYRIIDNDSTLHYLKQGMQLYFLHDRSRQAWNTYRASNLMLTVFKDMLAQGENINSIPKVTINNQVVKEFPYKTTLAGGKQLQLKQESGLPVYYMQYVHERVTKAKIGIEGFEINSYFENKSDMLIAGVATKLYVDIIIKGDVDQEYIMINVPIPASCSYNSKNQYNYGWNRTEAYREYYKEEVAIFSEKMSPGKHRFEINLLPRFTGKFILNPAQVSLMYFPVVNANEDLKILHVKE